ncbi:MAG: hypothetical protein AB7Q97_26605 [Gammaproteobacteria bacterium]
MFEHTHPRRRRVLKLLVASIVAANRAAIAAGHETNARTPGAQVELELLALRLIQAPEVQEAMAQARSILLADPVAATPDGQASLDDAAMQHAYAAVQRVTNLDPHHPRILVISQYEHEVAGRTFPSALHGGLENPDNVYRVIPISHDSRYLLRGIRHRPAPAQVTYELKTTVPGLRYSLGDRAAAPIKADAEMGDQISMLQDRDMAISADGSFTITIDADPANGRPNHIQTTEQARVLFIRDTLSDWTRQTHDGLAIERVAGPQTPPRSEQALIDAAAEVVVSFTRFWSEFKHGYIGRNRESYTVNRKVPVRARAGGWGFIVNTHYAVKDDEALIVTTDPLDAPYFSIMLGNHWWIAMEASRHTGSFNIAQASLNPDGTCTFVIANRDPGVHNWLDTGGIREGVIQIRWQGTPPSMTTAEGALRDVKLVRLSRLREELPGHTVWLTPGQRRAQLLARHASYKRRLA